MAWPEAAANRTIGKHRCLTEVEIRETLRTSIDESACEELEARMMGYEEGTGWRRDLVLAKRNAGLDSHCVTVALPGLRLQHYIRVSLLPILAPVRSNSLPNRPAPFCASAVGSDTRNTRQPHNIDILTSQNAFRGKKW